MHEVNNALSVYFLPGTGVCPCLHGPYYRERSQTAFSGLHQRCYERPVAEHVYHRCVEVVSAQQRVTHKQLGRELSRCSTATCKVAHPNLFMFLGHLQLQRVTQDTEAEVARVNRGMSIRHSTPDARLSR